MRKQLLITIKLLLNSVVSPSGVIIHNGIVPKVIKRRCNKVVPHLLYLKEISARNSPDKSPINRDLRGVYPVSNGATTDGTGSAGMTDPGSLIWPFL